MRQRSVSLVFGNTSLVHSHGISFRMDFFRQSDLFRGCRTYPTMSAASHSSCVGISEPAAARDGGCGLS